MVLGTIDLTSVKEIPLPQISYINQGRKLKLNLNLSKIVSTYIIRPSELAVTTPSEYISEISVEERRIKKGYEKDDVFYENNKPKQVLKFLQTEKEYSIYRALKKDIYF